MAPIPAMTSNFAPKKRIENWVTMLARGLLARFRFAPEPEEPVRISRAAIAEQVIVATETTSIDVALFLPGGAREKGTARGRGNDQSDAFMGRPPHSVRTLCESSVSI